MTSLAWAVAILITLLAPPGPGAQQRWKSFDSLEATYAWRYHMDSDTPDSNQQGTMQLWYQAPDRYRLIQTYDGGQSGEVITVVGDAVGARLYAAQERVVMWTPANNATAGSLGIGNLDLAGTAGPFASFQQEVRDALDLMSDPDAGWQRLPDETIAGRKAMVLVERIPAGEETIGHPAEFTTKYWVDQEYGILLGEEAAEPGFSESSEHLTSLRINPKLDEKLFQLDVPAGVVTLKGPFPGFSASDLASGWDVEGLGMETTPELPEGAPPSSVLAPAALPAGFVTFSFTQSAVQDQGKPDATWSTTIPYVNPKTGGFIQFTQGTSDEVRPQERADRDERVTVGKSPATVYHYDQPYPHLALVWTAGGITYSLEGSEVTLAQLQAMAEGMKPVAAVAGARWKRFDSLEITYAASGRSFDPETTYVPAQGGYRLLYVAPDHCRQYVAGTGGGDWLTTVGDAEGLRVYIPSYHLLVWAPADTAHTVDGDLAGTEGPFASFQAEMRSWIDRPRSEEGTARTLPDETIAGRSATVLTWQSAGYDSSPPPPWATKQKYWIDKEYGIPLAGETEWPRGISAYRATSIHINRAIDTKVFELDLPAGVRTIRGPFAPEDPVEFAGDWSEDLEPIGNLPTLPDQARPLTGLLPRGLPEGFGNMNEGGSAGSDRPGDTWSISIPYANRKTGGVVEFVQGTSEEVDRREKPDRTEQTTIRKSPATALFFSKPYPHLAVVWGAGGVKYALEGSGVALEELRAMAEAMEQVTVQPDSAEEHGDE